VAVGEFQEGVDVLFDEEDDLAFGPKVLENMTRF